MEKLPFLWKNIFSHQKSNFSNGKGNLSTRKATFPMEKATFGSPVRQPPPQNGDGPCLYIALFDRSEHSAHEDLSMLRTVSV